MKYYYLILIIDLHIIKIIYLILFLQIKLYFIFEAKYIMLLVFNILFYYISELILL